MKPRPREVEDPGGALGVTFLCAGRGCPLFAEQPSLFGSAGEALCLATEAAPLSICVPVYASLAERLSELRKRGLA